MRFLHTADWHLGRAIRGKSRAAESEAVLAELVDIARAERIDVMLVCGDIWDSATPAPESDRLLFEVLREFVGLGVQVVLVAGNHDNPRRLEALGRLSDLLGVYTQAQVKRPDAGGVLTLRKGDEMARIAAIPWIPEGRMVDAAEVMGMEYERIQQYAEGVGRIYRQMCQGFTDETVNVVAGHLFVDGAQLAAVDGSERRLHIEQAYGVQAAALPSTPQYVALGHIHQPQVVQNAPAPTAYAGSLLQLDFGERDQQKVVRIVDVRPRRPADEYPVPLTKGRRLVEVRWTLDEVVERAAEVADAYTRVRLKVDRPEPGLAQRVREVIPLAVDVQLDYTHQPEEAPEPGLGHLSPADLFARYYRGQHRSEPAPELLGLFTELLEEATSLEARDGA